MCRLQRKTVLLTDVVLSNVPSVLYPHFSPAPTPNLLNRINSLLRDAARAVSVIIPVALSHSSCTPKDIKKDMAPVLTNGINSAGGANNKGSQSQKMHSKVVSFIPLFESVFA